MSYQTILYETANGVAKITLNRPETLNAFNDLMIEETTNAFKQAGRDAAVRCVVLTGSGRGFCSGQDLADTQERGDSFSIGGIDDDEGPVDGCLRRADVLAPAPGRFDPDGFAAPSGGGEIAAIKVVDGQGRPMAPAHGGQEVEIRITCRAARALTRPSVCFLVRDKFAQVLFGDRTPGGDEAPAAMAAGEERDARFVFTLPFLPSNDYVVEALLLEQGGDGDQVGSGAVRPREEQLRCPSSDR